MPRDDAAPPTRRAPQLGALGAVVGVMSVGMTNKLRKRPAGYQPWLHLTAAVVGVYLGGKLGNLYDDVNVVVEKQLRDSTIVPTWAYGTLSPAELDAQLKRQRLADMHQKFATLAEAEEKEYQKNKPVHTGAPHKLFQ